MPPQGNVVEQIAGVLRVGWVKPLPLRKLFGLSVIFPVRPSHTADGRT